MTVLEAISILEAATLECKKRDISTPEVRAALDFVRAAHSTGVVDSTYIEVDENGRWTP